MSAVAKILDRLERVKTTGPGRWIACCPAHEDRSPSLSVRDVDDRILIHCFGGCSASDVVAALGLELRDLYDTPLSQGLAPVRSRIPARDVLEAVSFEIDAAAILLANVLESRSISELGWQRVATAAARIGAARNHVHGP